MYYIYMIRCLDNSIYTGITKDLEKRFLEHFNQSEKCAKYTKSRKAIKLEIAWQTDNRVNASKLEYRIKQLNKIKKEDLIKNPNLLEKYFKNELECNNYIIAN